MPNLRQRCSIFGKLYYYPKLESEGSYQDPFTGRGLYVRYSQVSYELGFFERIGRSNTFMTASVGGDSVKKLATLPPQAPGSSNAAILSLGYALRL
jgi:hypothetical protein